MLTNGEELDYPLPMDTLSTQTYVGAANSREEKALIAFSYFPYQLMCPRGLGINMEDTHESHTEALGFYE